MHQSGANRVLNFLSLKAQLVVFVSVSASEMTYIASGGALNSTHSLTFVSVFSKSTIILVVLVSAYVMVSTVLSVSCLLFFYSRCPPFPAICKSGGHVPPSP